MSDQKVSHDALHEIGICDCALGEAGLQSRAQDMVAGAIQRIAQSQIRLGKRGRGMMTAEQFRQAWKPVFRERGSWGTTDVDEFAEAYTAAQLAEKERLYAFCEVHGGQKMQSCPCCEAVHQADLREAAEQRLQEAQAELDALRAGARTGLLKYCMAGDVGQFADRMRNLLQAEDWNGLKNCVTDFFNYAKDRTESIFPMHEAELAEVNSRLRQREAELEQRWIAVEERLPDGPQHDVLLWTADDWEGGKNFQQIGIIGEFNRDEWDGKVTHWQPLPSPPKVQP